MVPHPRLWYHFSLKITSSRRFRAADEVFLCIHILILIYNFVCWISSNGKCDVARCQHWRKHSTTRKHLFFFLKKESLLLNELHLSKETIYSVLSPQKHYARKLTNLDKFLFHDILVPMNVTSQLPILTRPSWTHEMMVQYDLWHAEVSHEHWSEDSDILERYPQAAIFPHRTVVFPILHGEMVIATHVEYQLRRVYVTFVGPRKDWQSSVRKPA